MSEKQPLPLTLEQLSKITNLVDSSYFFYKAILAGRVPQANVPVSEMIVMKQWVENYEVLQAELIKASGNVTVH